MCKAGENGNADCAKPAERDAVRAGGQVVLTLGELCAPLYTGIGRVWAGHGHHVCTWWGRKQLLPPDFALGEQVD